MKIKILSEGKTKEKWLKDAIDEYIKRLKATLRLELIEAKNTAQLITISHDLRHPICLDPQGEEMTSEKFSTYLHQHLVTHGSQADFIIGGAHGLPEEIKNNHFILSLSHLTFTHQMCRLILIEQIYRAFEIAKGSKYHK